MYQSIIDKNNMKFQFSACYPFMEKMCKEVENYSINNNLIKYKFTLSLCLREAVTNSIKHGSNNDPEKKIKVSIDYNKNSIQIIVEDEGPGFDWKNHVSKPSERLTQGGRGLVIMDEYCLEKEYNEIGNKVRLLIKLK